MEPKTVIKLQTGFKISSGNYESIQHCFQSFGNVLLKNAV